MLFVYPAIFHKEDNSYWVEFPDLEGCQSYGDTLEETIENAKEALEVYIETKFEQRLSLNKPSDIKQLELDENSFTSLIYCDISNYLKRSKAVKKTLTIPEWLNDLATEKNINFSQTLQNALMKELHVNE